LVVELSLDRIGEQAGTDLDRGGQLIAPPLLWSEVPSALHEMAFRGEISNALAELALQRFLSGKLSIGEQRPERLATAAWEVAEEFGWAKTYTPSTWRLRRPKAVASSPLTADCVGARTDWGSSSRRLSWPEPGETLDVSQSRVVRGRACFIRSAVFPPWGRA